MNNDTDQDPELFVQELPAKTEILNTSKSTKVYSTEFCTEYQGLRFASQKLYNSMKSVAINGMSQLPPLKRVDWMVTLKGPKSLTFIAPQRR